MENDIPQNTAGWHPEPLAKAAAVLSQRNRQLPETIVRALAREVLARLDERRRATDDKPSVAMIHDLADALVSVDPGAGMEKVMNAQAGGMSVDTMHLSYIAEAVRVLGKRWEEDTLSFAEVTMGAGRVYAILRRLREVFVTALISSRGPVRAAFASTPGETHTLGVTMAADHMRRRGWEIDLHVGLDHANLVRILGETRYPVIGISASSDQSVFALARLVVALRVSNPYAWIIIGGPLAASDPDIATLVDADAASADAVEAEALIAEQMQQFAALEAGKG